MSWRAWWITPPGDCLLSTPRRQSRPSVTHWRQSMHYAPPVPSAMAGCSTTRRTDPRADLATAGQLLDQLPAAPAEQSALLAAAAHLRQAIRALAGR